MNKAHTSHTCGHRDNFYVLLSETFHKSIAHISFYIMVSSSELISFPQLILKDLASVYHYMYIWLHIHGHDMQPNSAYILIHMHIHVFAHIQMSTQCTNAY